MRAARAYQAVGQQTAVMAAGTVDLVLLLYDKLLDRIREARQAIEAEDIPGRGRFTGLAIEIIEKGLIGSLDDRRGGELARRLRQQYEIWMFQLLKANLEASAALLDSVEGQVRTVRSAWQDLKSTTSS